VENREDQQFTLRFVIRKTQSLRYYSAPEAKSVRTERLAERETILYRFGSEFNRTLSNYRGDPMSRSGNITWVLCVTGF
jgi:hypothetical protein